MGRGLPGDSAGFGTACPADLPGGRTGHGGTAASAAAGLDRTGGHPFFRLFASSPSFAPFVSFASFASFAWGAVYSVGFFAGRTACSVAGCALVEPACSAAEAAFRG